MAKWITDEDKKDANHNYIYRIICTAARCDPAIALYRQRIDRPAAGILRINRTWNRCEGDADYSFNPSATRACGSNLRRCTRGIGIFAADIF